MWGLGQMASSVTLFARGPTASKAAEAFAAGSSTPSGDLAPNWRRAVRMQCYATEAVTARRMASAGWPHKVLHDGRASSRDTLLRHNGARQD